jgi:hypothetical protein
MQENASRRANEAIAKQGKWRHRIEVAPGVWTPGLQDTPALLALDRIHDVCAPEATLLVETHMIDEGLVDGEGFEPLDSWQHAFRGGAVARRRQLDAAGERAVDEAASWDMTTWTVEKATSMSGPTL